jgi:hypothetical protein
MTALAAGTNLGPYEVISLVGAGGMGEVYRARDPRLGREVAIKVLPQQLSADAERLRRFDQEARAAGMLNHPNILTIYDIGSENGTVYVVSELLMGETLRERLGGTALPVRKAIEFSLQIAHGLAAAHEKGIVHRDLKPENLFVTKDGRVKILDFGLAKLIDPQSASEEQSRLQTLDGGTEPGMVLGTVGYMSPEQVRGRAADHRSDIFAFGAILYEMLTGKRAFHRDSTADTMSAILKEDPPELSSINRGVPPSLERVVRHCLEKNAEERFQSARDLAFDLEMLSGTSGSAATSAVTPVADRKGLRKAIAVALLLAALAAAFLAGRQAGGKVQTHTSPLTETDFKRLTFRRGFVSAARFAPDGQSVVYSASWVGNPEELFITTPQSPTSRSLGLTNVALLSVSGTREMAVLVNPVFTSGWQRIGTLARAPIDGGAPREVLKDVQDADWAPNNQDIAVAHAVDGRYKLEYPIGKVLYDTEGWLNNVHVSPDGERVAFMDHPGGGDDRGTVDVVDRTGKFKRLTQEFASESGLHWSPDGSEIWFTASTEGSNEQPVYAVTLQGQQRVLVAMVGNLILHDVRPDGSALLTRDSRRREIVALPPGETHERDLSWFDWSFSRDLSEDGKTLLFEEQGAGGGPNYSVFLRQTDGSPAVRLGDGFATSLSPDGKLVVSRLPNDPNRLTILPTGAGESKVVSIPGFTFFLGGMPWLQDSRRFLTAGHQQGRPARWWIYDSQTGKITPVTPEGTAGGGALITPDQTAMLTHSPDAAALYPFNGGEPQKVTALRADDALLRWTSDGRGVFVGHGEKLPAVIERVDLATGQRTVWKEITPPDPSGIAGLISMLITPDGKTYVYTYRRVLSDLYRISRLQ